MKKNRIGFVFPARGKLKKTLLVMKLTTLFVMALLVQVNATVYSQNAKFNGDYRGKTIREVFNSIESQSRYRFFFNNDFVDIDRVVDFSVKDENVRDILDRLFKNSDISYKIMDNDLIVITTSSSAGMQQATPVKGAVTDHDGSPLPGVTVVVKGTTNGTITDADGNFSLGNVPSGGTLVFSFVGMRTVEMPAGHQKMFNIQMEEESVGLEEVVAVGYGIQKRETLTGSISSINATDIQRSEATTTSTALVGKIAGVNARMSDGRPGNSTSIQIRNMGTPLYVIDGVQKDEGQFNNIDYNDIESISILKDASAAIYGVRAANGVVVVTTKKGKRNTKNVVNVKASYGWQKMFKFPKPADAETYITSYIQSDAITGNPSPKYTMDDLAKWKEGKEKGYRPFDWYDYILITAPQDYVGVNTSGGSENINYYISLSHLDQKAAILNYGGFYRTNFQFNVGANISEKLKIGADINGRIEERKHPGVPGGDDTWQALFAIYRNLPTARPFANDNPKYPQQTSANSGTNFGMLTYDMAGRYKETWRVLQLNFNAEYEIMKGLTLKGVLGYYFATKWMDNQEYTYKLYTYDEETDTYPVSFSMDNPYRERDIRQVEEVMTQVQLNYNKQLGKHSLSALLASETYKRDTPGFYTHTRPESNSLHLLDYQTMDTFNDDGNNTQARAGFIGRVNYNYLQKYLFEFAARYDGSWKFPPGDRWGFFPSASVGWRISEENFWKGFSASNVVTNLKLRASYGLLGDDDLGDSYHAFDYMEGYNYRNGGAVLDGQYYVGASPRGLPVTTLSWIKAKDLDIGLDFGLWNNKLSGSIDFFNRKRTGLPAARYDVLIPAEVGFSLPNENLNSDRNTGFDGFLKWNDQVGKLNYSVGANFTYARQYDWHQYKPRFGNSWNEYRNSIDERFSYITWGYDCIGQFQSWEEIAGYPVDIDGQGNKTLRPGDLIYQDENGDKVINSMDERPMGFRNGSTPIFNFGLNLYCSWKGIDLAIDFAGATGYTYQYDWESKRPFHDGGNNPQYYMGNQWHLSDPSDPDSELIPGKYPTLIVGNQGHSNYWRSDFWSVNGRYIKLKNLELGYNLPALWANKIGMSKVRIYTMGQNLFSIDNLKGVDPEITSDSGVQYPTNRVISVGVNITF